MNKIAILFGALALTAAPVGAAEKPTALIYRDKPVNGYLGGSSAFPAAFVGAPLCEGGKSASDASSGCVSLNNDGTGTWENDVGPGARQPPAPIKWYVIADQGGTVTRVSDADADTYFVIFEFTAPYYSRAVGDMIAFPARHIKSAPARVVIDSKYRNLN
ncbi:hypothetical protein [Sphingopyxis sp.]|uniref:hypothetical protein n=1 Tax=Sphingopyxis sp. TaxID=1908224 RepID=UPI003D096456